MNVVAITDVYSGQPLELVKKSPAESEEQFPVGGWLGHVVKLYNSYVLNNLSLRLVTRQAFPLDPNQMLLRIINDYALRIFNLKVVGFSKKPALELKWSEYSLKIPRSQLETLSMDLVLEILTQTAKSPTELAGLNKKDIIHPLLLQLNQDFERAQSKYKNALDIAETQDLAKINKLEKTYDVRSYGGLSGPVFRILEACGSNYRSTDFVETEGAAHRIKFLYDVNHDEIERRQKIKDLIELALDPLIEDLAILKGKNLVDMNRLQQAKQLSKVYKAVFPSELLMKGGKEINAILAEFNPPH